MIWPFHRKPTTETGAEFYIRDAAVADAKALVDFKHRAWRHMFGRLKDDAFFAKAEATTGEQVKFWQSRISRGDTVWMAEDLRDRLVGTIHATTQHSDQTTALVRQHNLAGSHELRFFYLADTAVNTTIGEALIQRAVDDKPAIAWLAGQAPALETSLQRAGFVPLGSPVDPAGEPWRGVPQQAMVRK